MKEPFPPGFYIRLRNKIQVTIHGNKSIQCYSDYNLLSTLYSHHVGHSIYYLDKDNYYLQYCEVPFYILSPTESAAERIKQSSLLEHFTPIK